LVAVLQNLYDKREKHSITQVFRIERNFNRVPNWSNVQAFESFWLDWIFIKIQEIKTKNKYYYKLLYEIINISKFIELLFTKQFNKF